MLNEEKVTFKKWGTKFKLIFRWVKWEGINFYNGIPLFSKYFKILNNMCTRHCAQNLTFIISLNVYLLLEADSIILWISLIRKQVQEGDLFTFAVFQ